jgi:hypothetical protein
MIEMLEEPISIENEWGLFTITHFTYNFSCLMSENKLRFEKIYGKLDGNGNFVPCEYIPRNLKKFGIIDSIDFKELLQPNDKGKQQNLFRSDDVMKLIKKKLTKPIKEPIETPIKGVK